MTPEQKTEAACEFYNTARKVFETPEDERARAYPWYFYPPVAGLSATNEMVANRIATDVLRKYLPPHTVAKTPGGWLLSFPSESDATMFQLAGMKWAEGLIRQLPENHDGRNSWLLNHGTGPDVEKMRDEHPTYRETMSVLTDMRRKVESVSEDVAITWSDPPADFYAGKPMCRPLQFVAAETRYDVKCACVGATGPDPECGACGGTGTVGSNITAATIEGDGFRLDIGAGSLQVFATKPQPANTSRKTIREVVYQGFFDLDAIRKATDGVSSAALEQEIDSKTGEITLTRSRPETDVECGSRIYTEQTAYEEFRELERLFAKYGDPTKYETTPRAIIGNPG